MKRTRNLCLVLVCAASNALALNSSDWQFEQEFAVETSGMVKVEIPTAAVAGSRNDLADLRILDEAGSEVPFAILPPPRPRNTDERAKEQSIAIIDEVTTIQGRFTSENILALEIESPNETFIGAADVEIRKGTDTWRPLKKGAPLFRQNGKEQLLILCGGQTFDQVRCFIRKEGGLDFVVTGVIARLAPEEAPEAQLHTVPFSVEEYGKDTVVTLKLGTSNLPIENVVFEIGTPIFERSVKAYCRVFKEDILEDELVGEGQIQRGPGEGLNAADGAIAVFKRPVNEEMTLRIANGDSPPLTITSARIRLHATYLAFNASSRAKYHFLFGNHEAQRPTYDLKAFAADLTEVPEVKIDAKPSTPSKSFHAVVAPLPLPDGATLDTSHWKIGRKINLNSGGLQELELDTSAMAALKSDFSDLRLMRRGKQVPYLMERTNLERSIDTAIHFESHDSISRWTIKLPQKNMRIAGLELQASNSIFRRNLRLLQQVEDPRNGNQYFQDVGASIDWVRNNPNQPTALDWRTNSRPGTDTVFIQTNNGDNEALILNQIRIRTPVVRVYFWAEKDDAVSLLCDNPSATEPRYDLALISERVLKADRQKAKLDPAATTATRPTSNFESPILWIVLAGVVAGLLAIIARLLPKSSESA